MKKLMIAAAVACVASVLVSGCAKEEPAPAAAAVQKAAYGAKAATADAKKAADAAKADVKKATDAAKPAAK